MWVQQVLWSRETRTHQRRPETNNVLHRVAEILRSEKISYPTARPYTTHGHTLRLHHPETQREVWSVCWNRMLWFFPRTENRVQIQTMNLYFMPLFIGELIGWTPAARILGGEKVGGSLLRSQCTLEKSTIMVVCCGILEPWPWIGLGTW